MQQLNAYIIEDVLELLTRGAAKYLPLKGDKNGHCHVDQYHGRATNHSVPQTIKTEADL